MLNFSKQKQVAAHPNMQSDESAMTISIIIVNYNSVDYIYQCLEAIEQTVPPETEVIVVDNASTDQCGDEIAHRWPRVRLIRSEENLGFGGANNLGAKEANGRILVFINPDTVPQAGWLLPLTAPLQASDTVGLTTAKILIQSAPNKINAAGNDIHCSGITLCRGLYQPAEDFAETAIVNAISGATFAISRQLFVDLGGFDAAFFMYMEDTDLSWRARLAGWQTVYIPDSIIWHDYALTFGQNKVFYQERNRYLMLLKSLQWGTILLMLPILLAAESISWGFVLLQDRPNWRNKLKAYWWIYRHWPEIRQKRADVQRTRRQPDRTLIQAMSVQLAFDQTRTGIIATLAHWAFNPFFFLYHSLLRLGVRW